MRALIIGLVVVAIIAIIAGVKIIGRDVKALQKTRNPAVHKIESVYSIGDRLEAKQPGTVRRVRERVGG